MIHINKLGLGLLIMLFAIGALLSVFVSQVEIASAEAPAGCYEEVSEGTFRSVDCPNFVLQESVEIQGSCFVGENPISCEEITLADGVDTANEEGVAEGEEGEAAADDVGCDEQGGILGFIMCPLLWGLDTAINTLDSAVTSILKVDYDRLTENGQLENAWAQFRNIAYILLIPTMLMMVIGTALGFQFLDAYTVKRALPRMLVAVIFIALSWEICRVMIEATNLVGDGVAGLIGAAVQPEDGTLAELQLRDLFTTPENVAATLGVTAGGSALLVGGVILAAIGGGVLLSVIGYVLLLLLSAFVALGIAFFLLALRQMLIIALIVIAPIAILAWIFPGNDKPWKLWWGSFTKLLLLFPIIILLLVTGRAFAYIIFTTGGVANQGIVSALVDFTLKLVAYIGPFFLIPATFKLAGSAFANLSGMVNDKSRGFFDKNRKRRAQLKGYAGKESWKKAKTGTLFRENSALGKRGLSSTAQKLTNLDKVTSLKPSQIRKDLNRAVSVGALGELGHAMEDAEMQPADDDTMSGVASDLSMGNEEGLKRNLAFKLKAARLKQLGLIDSETGEFTGTEAEMTSARNWAMAQATTHARTAMKLMEDGKEEEAHRYMWNQWAGDPQDAKQRAALETKMDNDWSSIRRLRSKYDRETLDRAFTLKAMAGGTYYADDYTTWRAAEKATHGDSNAKATMVVQGRKALMGAGRSLEGAGGFGATMTVMTEAGDTIDAVEIDKLSKKFRKKVKEQNGVSVFLHQSNKDSYMEENLIPLVQEELREAYASGDEQRINRTVAEAEFMHKQLGSTKPAFQKIFGEQVLGYSPSEGRVVPTEEQGRYRDQQEGYAKLYQEYQKEAQRRQQVVEDIRSGKSFDSRGQALPRFPTDAQGNLIIPDEYKPPLPPPQPDIPITTRTLIYERSSDPAYQNISYQFEVAERQYQQQIAAQQAAAAQQQNPPGGGSPGGTGPGPGPIITT